MSTAPSPLVPLPRVPLEAYQRSFLIDSRGKVEVTSVDVSSHGMFLVVGCSNGVVLLYNLTKKNSDAIYLGQIACKGIHSILSLRVKISDDCRFCFVGAIRGSNELHAIDLCHLKWEWNEAEFARDFTVSKGKKALVGPTKVQVPSIDPTTKLPDLFETFIYADAKLKGFGACCSKVGAQAIAENGQIGNQYLLACGMGIKNVHVWQMTVFDEVVIMSSESAVARKDHWKCIYDVSTNGNTITHLGFRNAGRELITKSGNFNIRVWDISRYRDDEPASKPAYEDIANSNDVKCLLETSDFAYGGMYEFLMVKVDKNIPKEANRNVFELPEKSAAGANAAQMTPYEEGVRRRRTMREVVDVVGTQDGEHVLVKVADGGVLHFHHPKTTHPRSESPTGKANKLVTTPRSSSGHSDKMEVDGEDKENGENNENSDDEEESEEEENDDNDASMGNLLELQAPGRDGELEQAWNLKRVGSEGMVVVARAYFRPDPKEKSSRSNASSGNNGSNGSNNGGNGNGSGVINGLTPLPPVVKGTTMLSIFSLSTLLRQPPSLSSASPSAETQLRHWHPTGTYYRSPKTVDVATIQALTRELSAASQASSGSETPHTTGTVMNIMGAGEVPYLAPENTAGNFPSSFAPSSNSATSNDAVSTPASKQSPNGVAVGAGVFPGSEGPPALKKRKTSAVTTNHYEYEESTVISGTPAASNVSSARKPPLAPQLSRQTSTASTQQQIQRSAVSTPCSNSKGPRNHVQHLFEEAAIAAGMSPEEDANQPRARSAYNTKRSQQQQQLFEQQQQQVTTSGSKSKRSWIDLDPVQHAPITIAAQPAYVPFTPSTRIIPLARPAAASLTSIATGSGAFLSPVVSLNKLASSTVVTNRDEVWSTINLLVQQWRNALQATAQTPECLLSTSSLTTKQSLGIYAHQQLGRILGEQERLKQLFVVEVCRTLDQQRETILRTVLSSSSSVGTPMKETDADWLHKVITRFEHLVEEETARQQSDFDAAQNRDVIASASSHASSVVASPPKVVFRYADMFSRTRHLQSSIVSLRHCV